MFAVAYPIQEKGEYTFTLAVESLQGKNFSEPLIYDGTISYQEKCRAPLYRMIFVIGVILFSSLLGAGILYQRKSLKMEPGQKLNLLDIPWLRSLLKSA